MACQSILFAVEKEAVLLEDTAAFGGEQEIAEGAGGGGVFEDDAALLHARVRACGRSPRRRRGRHRRELRCGFAYRNCRSIRRKSGVGWDNGKRIPRERS